MTTKTADISKDQQVARHIAHPTKVQDVALGCMQEQDLCLKNHMHDSCHGIKSTLGAENGGGGATSTFQRVLRLRSPKVYPLPSYVTPSVLQSVPPVKNASKSNVVGLRDVFVGKVYCGSLRHG